MTKKIFLYPIILIIGFVILTFALPVNSSERSATLSWTRNLEPVILTGSQLTQFSGVDLSNLFAYALTNGSWEQIPLQIDEVNASGEYGVENGILDGDDEVVFMAMDLGEAAFVSDWIDDPASRTHSRIQIQVTNPLNPTEIGFMYLYQSTTISPTHDDYAAWDDATKMITAATYRLRLAIPYQGVDTLELNGNPVDVLDQSKFRLSGVCRTFGTDNPFSYTEELELPDELKDLIVFEPDIDGPVRVGGGSMTKKNWSYHSMRVNQYGIDFETLKDIICFSPLSNFGYFDQFRVSYDWVNPTNSGMTPMSYFDSNTAGGVSVDGNSDSIPTSPVNAWSQVSGSFGSMVRVTDISENIIGTVENYYKDRSATDIEDTGDQQSFGDAGFKVQFSPTQPEYGQFEVVASDYFLAPLQPNLGSTYDGYVNNPLQVSISSQDYVSVHYFPLVIKSDP